MVCQKGEAWNILIAIIKTDSYLTISFDVRGNTVNKLNKTQSKIFYHVGFVQTGFGPLPLTEFFTDEQTTESLQIWLNKFKRSFSDKTVRRVTTAGLNCLHYR